MLEAALVLGDLGLARKAREWAQEHGRFPEKDMPYWHALNHLVALGEERNDLADKHLHGLMQIAGAHSDEVIRKQALVVLGEQAELFREVRVYRPIAETLCRKSLELSERFYGVEHPEVTICLDRLAGFFWSASRVTEAVTFMRRVVANNEKNLGPEHPTTARTLEALANFLRSTDGLTEAVLLRRRALAIYEKSSETNSTMVALAMDNLGLLLKDLGQMEEAEMFLRRSLAIQEEELGPEHIGVSIKLSHVGLLLFAAKRYQEAEPILRRALAILQKQSHGDRRGIARCLKELALLLQADQRPMEAEPLAREAVEIYLNSKTSNPWRQSAEDAYRGILADLKLSETEIEAKMRSLEPWTRAKTV